MRNLGARYWLRGSRRHLQERELTPGGATVQVAKLQGDHAQQAAAAGASEDLKHYFSQEIRRSLNAINLWRDYRLQQYGSRQAVRIVNLLAITLLALFFMVSMSGFPTAPTRGPITIVVVLATYFSFSLLTVMLLLLLDSTWLALAFVKRLSQHPTKYPAATLALIRDKWKFSDTLQAEDLEPWIDVELIADRTRVIGGYLITSFVVLSLLIVSRSSVFDTWEFNPGIVGAFAALALVALAAVVQLHLASSRARRVALAELQARVHRYQNAARLEAPAAKPESKANIPEGGGGGATTLADARSAKSNQIAFQELSQLAERVDKIREGAFAPVYDHPVVKAAMVPVGGLSIVQILEYLVRVPS